MLYNTIKMFFRSDRLKKRKKIISSLLVLSLLVPSWYVGNYSLKLNELTIPCDKVEESVKIAVISDLHGDSFGKDNQKITDLIAGSKPDLIFVLGDMYTRNRYDKIDFAVSFVERLSEIAQTFVITGDHDTDDEYADKIRLLQNVQLLDYKKTDLTVNGNEITLYGIDNVYFTQSFDLHNEFDEPDPERLNILLAHLPETERYEGFGVDLIFSGDTHGGMIRLPLLGPIYYNGYLLPKLTYPNRLTDKGLYSFDNKQIFVTSGLGDYPVPLRFLNRPEVCIITLKKETDK